MSGAVLVGAAALIACGPAFAKDAVDPAAHPTPASDADPFPIYVRVTLGTVLLAKRGATAPAARRSMPSRSRDERFRLGSVQRP
jgi:hypothetical protein